MQNALENLIDHPEMILPAIKLFLQVDQIIGDRVQTLCEQPRDMEIQVWMSPQKRFSVIDHKEGRCFHGTNGRHVWAPEKNRHFAKDRPGRSDHVDLDGLLQNFNRPLFENVQSSTMAILNKDFLALRNLNFRESCTNFDRGFHG